jgi:hypothetical protein
MHRDAHPKLKGLIPAFLGLLMVLVACKSDPCEDVSCVQGDCQEGVCNCAAYYEGESCDTESRTKFLGTNCPSGSQFLVTTIQAGTTNAGQVMLTNIHQDPDTIAGHVNGDTLTIPMQAYGFEYIEGTGFYSEGSITLEYKVIQTTGGETECIAHLTR